MVTGFENFWKENCYTKCWQPVDKQLLPEKKFRLSFLPHDTCLMTSILNFWTCVISCQLYHPCYTTDDFLQITAQNRIDFWWDDIRINSRLYRPRCCELEKSHTDSIQRKDWKSNGRRLLYNLDQTTEIKQSWYAKWPACSLKILSKTEKSCSEPHGNKFRSRVG